MGGQQRLKQGREKLVGGRGGGRVGVEEVEEGQRSKALLQQGLQWAGGGSKEGWLGARA